MAGMAIRPNFKRKKIGNHYNSVVRARMGYNTSLMLTNFFTIFVPQHGHFHGHFVTLKWVLFVRPWYIRRRIEKNNFCELVVVSANLLNARTNYLLTYEGAICADFQEGEHIFTLIEHTCKVRSVIYFITWQ